MTEKTDPPSTAAQAPLTAAPLSASKSKPQKKPRFALFIATAAGLGYLPVAPGTWGSLAGAAIYVVLGSILRRQSVAIINILTLSGGVTFWSMEWLTPHPLEFLAGLIVAGIGVWVSNHVSDRSGEKDPQYVVIDEVSGQQLTYLLTFVAGNWKSLLLGFILFRVFDIWKPSPVRQAESLPGGWGIMADDWVAAVYAALITWSIRLADQWLAHLSGRSPLF
jgi:phosphatidylglycerophosphatase A